MKTLMVFASLLFMASCDFSHKTTTKAENTILPKIIVLQATGKIETAPNRAHFSVTINCLDKEMEAAKQCLIDRTKALMSQLQSFGIDTQHIKTTDLQYQKAREWENGSYVFKGYKANSTTNITIQNLQKLNRIYTAMLAQQHFSVNLVQFTHSAHDSLQNEAYAMALENADRLADKLLSQMPENSKDLVQVSNVAFSPHKESGVKIFGNSEVKMEDLA